MRSVMTMNQRGALATLEREGRGDSIGLRLLDQRKQRDDTKTKASLKGE